MPRELRAEASFSSVPALFATRCAMKPPTRRGVFSSSGMYMPSAKASAGTPIICIEIAMSAPVP